MAAATSGYLSGRCQGNAWQIRALRGQRIELTLYDYSSSGSRDDDRYALHELSAKRQQRPHTDKSFDDSCPPLLRITERLSLLKKNDDDNDGVTDATPSPSAVPGRDVIVRIVRACDSPIRQRSVYTSRSHVITVSVMSPSDSGNWDDDDDDGSDSGISPRQERLNFLLHYQGCDKDVICSRQVWRRH